MSEQFTIIDINQYWRTGGTDYPELKASCNSVIIQAYNGARPNPILKEQIDGCVEHDIDYETFCIPNPDLDGKYMADLYLDLYGVFKAPKWLDAERVGGRMATQYKTWEFVQRVNEMSLGEIGYYSNYPRTMELGNPSWIRNMIVWWAEYPLYFTGIGWSQYRTFEKFFQDKPWWSPKWAAKLGISPTIHQFSKKGYAQVYGAKAYTEDPKFKVGIKSADLTAGLVSYDLYWNARFGPYLKDEEEPKDCPNDEEVKLLTASYKGLEKVVAEHAEILLDHGERLVSLEEEDETEDPPPPPPPPPPEDFVLAEIRLDDTDKEHTVAWAITSWNENKDGVMIPVIETNAYQVTQDPDLKFMDNELIRILPKAVISDGGKKWFELVLVKEYGFDRLFVQKDHAMKIT